MHGCRHAHKPRSGAPHRIDAHHLGLLADACAQRPVQEGHECGCETTPRLKTPRAFGHLQVAAGRPDLRGQCASQRAPANSRMNCSSSAAGNQNIDIAASAEFYQKAFGWKLAKRTQVFIPRIKWSVISSWDKALARVEQHDLRAKEV